MKSPHAPDHSLRKYLRLVFFASSLGMLLTIALGSGSYAGKMNGRNEDPIKIGVYLDLTGTLKSFGEPTRNGIKMAAAEINAQGGIGGRKIELIIEDDEGEPGKAATVVKKLIKEDKVHALLGEVASSNTLAAAPHAQQAQVPMISPSSTNPLVTQTRDYIFCTCFDDPFQGEVMAKFAFNNLKAKRAAIFFDMHSDYSAGLVKTFKQKFTKLGGTVIAEQSYSQSDRDFSEHLTMIRSAKPDVIYLPGYYPQAAAIARQAREMGIKQTLLGGDGWDAPPLWEIGGKALNNSYISNHYSADDPSPAVRRFVASYTEKYPKSEPDALAALGYDAMMVLADALRRAGTTEGSKLREAIAQTTNFPGVTGPITINDKRSATKPAIIVKLLDGKFVYHETIWPDSSDNH